LPKKLRRKEPEKKQASSKDEVREEAWMGSRGQGRRAGVGDGDFV